MRIECGWFLGAVVLAVASLPSLAQDPEQTPTADLVNSVLKDNGGKDAYAKANELERRLDLTGEPAAEAARLVLERVGDVVPAGKVRDRIDKLAREKGNKPADAARLVLGIVSAKRVVAQFKKGFVAVGRVVTADGKLNPEMVLAQMPILPDGSFAGEVGDLDRPIVFRAQGYLDRSVSLKGKSGEVIDAGDVVLDPMPADQAVGFKGRLQLDGAKDASGATVMASLSVPPANTPHNGYSPRRGWPEGQTVPVSPTGEFSVSGLSPGDYYLTVTAKDHVDVSQQVRILAGKAHDLGTIALKSSNLGFYIGAKAPAASPPLAWEKDYASALKRAATEKKPVMVMMTATWCGPCKMLEKETLDDPWIRSFLSRFVIVKAYEDKDVEKTYGLDGYPTLVFTDSAGKEASRTVGYQPVLNFAGQIARAHEKLGQPLPAELKQLADKKVLPNDR